MSRLLLLVLLVACSAAHAQLLVKDDAGRSLLVRKHFTRIVTLAPFLTEAAYAAGAGDLVVGVDALSDYPREAMRLPRVPTGAAFSLDAIAALKPDLVLAYRGGIRMEDVEAITSFGTTVYLAQGRHLEDVPRLLEAIGSFTGRDTRKVVADFVERLASIQRANEKKPKLAVFLEIWNRPLTTVPGDSLLSEAIGLCRGQNVFADLGGVAPQVEWEEVQEVNPYVILGVNSANNAQDFHANWSTHRNIRAVQENRLMYVESESLQRPTVRTVDSIARLCAELDQLRLHEQLIAPSEAYEIASGPAVAAADATPDVLRRPMTSVERDVAAVLASAYAVGQPAPEAPAPAAAPPSAPAPASPPPQESRAARAAEPAPAAAAVPPRPALEGTPPALRVASSIGSSASIAPAAPLPGAPATYTQVSRLGDLYFVSGQIAVDPDTGRFDGDAKIDAQTRATLENVRRALEGERLTLANVVATTVYLRDINDLDAMDRAYEAAFRTRLPARSVVEAKNLPRGARVQISAVAGR